VTIEGNACTKKSNTNYVCIVSDTVADATASYAIDNADGDSVTATINVDNNIGSMSYTVFNSQNSASLHYDVQDLGFDNNNACSGIKTLNVYSGSSIINTVDVNGDSGTCMYSGTINLSISDSGTRNISLEAIDNVGNNKTTPMQEIFIDLSAPKILNGMTVKYAGTDDDLSVIGGSSSFYVDIYFNVQEDSLSSINVDLSSANTNPVMQYVYKNLNVPLSNCEINSTSSSTSSSPSTSSVKTYTCYVHNVQLKLSGNELRMNVTAYDTYNNSATAELSKTFTIDNIVPQATIQTATCDTSGTCYVKNGMNTLIVTLNKQNFDKKYLFISVPDSTFGIVRVQNCSGTTCTAQVSLTCANGAQVEASITNYAGIDSQDDAGNVVTPYNTYFTCDNVAPIITDVNVAGDASSILKNITSGSTVTINAHVTESESTELVATAWLDKLKNTTATGNCVQNGTTGFDCTWIVGSIATGPYDVNLMINVSDSANNTASKPYKFRVFGYKSDNETPDNLGISLISVNPSTINRAVLGMATSNGIPYYVYATYDLSVVKGRDVAVLYQTVDVSKCTYKGILGTTTANAIFSEIKINNPYSTIEDTGRIDLKFKDNLDSIVNSIDDDFTITCNVSANVREGSYVYKKTQSLEISMKFQTVGTKLCSSGQDCTPGVALGDKIKDSENNFWVKNQFMGTINNWIPKLQSICKVRDYLSMGVFAGNVLSVLGNGVSLVVGDTTGKYGKVGVDVSKTLGSLDSCLSGASKSTAKLSLTAGSTTDTSDINVKSQTCGFVGQVCDFLSCDVASKFKDSKGTDTTNSVTDLFGKGFTVSGVGEEAWGAIQRNANVPDVSNSIIMSAYTGCFPAMYYNLNKYRQTECNYLYCLKTASYAGTDISMCDKIKYAQYCSYVVGELFEMHGLRTVKNYMNNAADLVKNSLPLAAASALKNTFCKEYIDFNTGKATMPTTTTTGQSLKIYGCQLPLQIARVIDINSRSRKIETFTYPQVPDMCEYAKCVGEPNCVHTPDIWDTLNKVTVPTPSITEDQYKKNQNTAQTHEDENSLRQLILMERLKAANDPVANSQSFETNYQTLVKQLQSKNMIGSDYNSGSATENYAKTMTIETDTGATYERVDNAGIITYTKYATDNTGAKIASTITPDEFTNEQSEGTDVVYVTNAYDDGTHTKTFEEDYSTSSYYTTSTVDSSGITTKQPVSATDYSTALGKENAAYSTQIDKADSNHNIDMISAQINSYNTCLHNGGTTNCNSLLYSGSTPYDPTHIPGIDYNLLATSPDDYKKLSPEKQHVVDTTRLQAYTQLDDLNKKAGPDNNKLTDQEVKQRAVLLQDLGMCKDQTDCDTYSKNLNIADFTKTEQSNKALINANAKNYNDYLKANQFGNTLFTALQYARASGFFKSMFSWYENTILGKTIGTISSYLDADKWKQSVCNPDFALNLGGTPSEGSVISCTTGNCIPALTYATQRTELNYPLNSTNSNETKYYVYTVVYFINGGDLTGHSINYNIYFNGDGASLQGYKDDVHLASNTIKEEKKVFKSSKKYTQMCVRFSEKFPIDNVILAKNEYCRDITFDVLNNGSPWVDTTIQNSTTNGGNVNTGVLG